MFSQVFQLLVKSVSLAFHKVVIFPILYLFFFYIYLLFFKNIGIDSS